jgi:cyclopropane fatty-acyl-phospholipid synthase-like methyltransferase
MTRTSIKYTTRAAGWPVIVCAFIAACAASAAAQLASRPAEEWRKVLDAPERVAALKVKEVIARLKLKPGDRVADLGAGTGPFVVPFARAVPTGTVYAVEVDDGFLPMIREKARAAGVKNVQTVLGVFTDPKLPAATIDLAFMHDVLHHIGDRPAYFRALTAYLKPGARLAIIDFHPARSPHQDQPALQVGKEQTRALLAGLGFTPIEDIPLFEEKWFLIFRKAS